MEKDKTSYYILSFYKFIHLSKEKVLDLQQSLERLTQSLQVKGLILIAPEGINATIAGKKTTISEIKSFLNVQLREALPYKESSCTFSPFKRMKVQIRKEIIKMKPIHPDTLEDSTYLSPEEWHKALKENKGVFVDARNWYETQIGTFTSAKVLDIKTFAEFGKKFKEMNISKNKPIYTFCTGGIRCEKACKEIKEIGYPHIYQLEGGILNYLQKYAGQKDNQWQGECFVFDHRVAVDTCMKPSKIYALCPHCGQPANNKFNCLECGNSTKLCDMCLNKQLSQTCSKNCAYHYENKQFQVTL